MKNNVPLFLAVAVTAAAAFFLYTNKKDGGKKPFAAGGVLSPGGGSIVPVFDAISAMKRVRNYENELKMFVAKNNGNAEYAFLIDMRIPSYRNRFFVFDLKKDSVVAAGLVAHGTGTQPRNRIDDLIFSNVPNSRCTSLGKYKISNSYTGAYGFSYRLIGLDTSNSNAMKRAIVLHGHSCVPDAEDTEYGWPICYSYGCPMVSTNFLQKLKGYISKQGKKPVVMWIFY